MADNSSKVLYGALTGNLLVAISKPSKEKYHAAADLGDLRWCDPRERARPRLRTVSRRCPAETARDLDCNKGRTRRQWSAKPWAIDFEHTEEALKGKTWKGIYFLDGDTLTICDNAPNLDEDRPASFEKSGSGYELITFERAVPDRA